MIDASALVDVLAGDRPSTGLLQRVSREPWHAPHFIDLELLNSLRRLVLRNQITVELAASVQSDFSLITISRYAHLGFRERIWELRDSMTAYDAAYIALAEALDAPLVTTDTRLGRASGRRCVVEVFE
ncbi:MAG: type II toxin-antitoxin system VapC family toxin [Actinomycetota bacterium]|nr:type II toxin-antitoxin system VapC family toxin [Actinomycetota bacterium]